MNSARFVFLANAVAPFEDLLVRQSFLNEVHEAVRWYPLHKGELSEYVGTEMSFDSLLHWLENHFGSLGPEDRRVTRQDELVRPYLDEKIGELRYFEQDCANGKYLMDKKNK